MAGWGATIQEDEKRIAESVAATKAAAAEPSLGEDLKNWTPPPRPFEDREEEYLAAVTSDGPFPRLESWAKPLLVGKHCALAPLHEGYADELFEAFTKPTAHATTSPDDVWRFLSVGPFGTSDDLRSFLREQVRGSTRDWSKFFMVVLDSPDPAIARPVGFISFLRIFPTDGSIETGFVTLSPSLQRTRTATEVHYLMMRHVFALGYRRYEWKCHSGNSHSRAAAQRLGFSFEGIHRQATIQKGRSRDTAWFSILDSEWPKLHDAFESYLAAENFDEEGCQRTSLSTLTRPLLSRADPGPEW